MSPSYIQSDFFKMIILILLLPCLKFTSGFSVVLQIKSKLATVTYKALYYKALYCSLLQTHLLG